MKDLGATKTGNRIKYEGIWRKLESQKGTTIHKKFETNCNFHVK